MRFGVVVGMLVLVCAGSAVAATSRQPRVGGACPASLAGKQIALRSGITLLCEKTGKALRWAKVASAGGGSSSGSGSGSGPGSGGSGGGGVNDTIKIENFQLRVGTYDPATGKAGDLVFSKAGLQPEVGLNSVFIEFGHQVHGQQTKNLPHFTFYAPLGTQVISPIDGVVVGIDDKSGATDQSLTVVPSDGSSWGVNLDHISDLTVQVGAHVTAGQVLGTVGVPIGTPAGWGANEMTVFKFTGQPHDEAHQVFVCPWEGWDPAKLKTAQDTITALMAAWESWYGDSTVYDEAHQVSPGCDFESEPAF